MPEPLRSFFPDDELEALLGLEERLHRKIKQASDPRALVPEVPKAIRDAAELIRTVRPVGWTLEQGDALVEKLEEAYPERIQRQIREAMRSNEDPTEQAVAVVAQVEELGLEPSPPPEPLPVTSEEDVHLVCWLAIVATGGQEQ